MRRARSSKVLRPLRRLLKQVKTLKQAAREQRRNLASVEARMDRLKARLALRRCAEGPARLRRLHPQLPQPRGHDARAVRAAAGRQPGLDLRMGDRAHHAARPQRRALPGGPQAGSAQGPGPRPAPGRPPRAGQGARPEEALGRGPALLERVGLAGPAPALRLRRGSGPRRGLAPHPGEEGERRAVRASPRARAASGPVPRTGSRAAGAVSAGESAPDASSPGPASSAPASGVLRRILVVLVHPSPPSLRDWAAARRVDVGSRREDGRAARLAAPAAPPPAGTGAALEASAGFRDALEAARTPPAWARAGQRAGSGAARRRRPRSTPPRPPTPGRGPRRCSCPTSGRASGPRSPRRCASSSRWRERAEAVVGLVEGGLLALHGLLDHGAPEHLLVLALQRQDGVHQQREAPPAASRSRWRSPAPAAAARARGPRRR